ncbi:hypothetical protein Q3G72_004124 [Acer saccharum]|nr:hypothetical protein Q3G72_004124 [Acer saccharum]
MSVSVSVLSWTRRVYGEEVDEVETAKRLTRSCAGFGEHIRPLCKSSVKTVEQYQSTVAITTDKVMKYHSNAKNANFLIKEGEKVKKLPEQYIEIEM